MPRYKITVEYEGGSFVGWQRQDTGPSIQASIEDAIFAFTAHRPHVQCAGRTDAGVHARGQVAHFDLPRELAVEAVRGAICFHLRPHPIVVTTAEIVPETFHARFSATGRRYRYRILNRRSPAALDREQVWHIPVPLNASAMADAATVLMGRHDFNSFRSVNCQSKTSIKTIDLLDVTRGGEEEIVIDIASRSFLHNQVRIIAGTLAMVGRGQWSKKDVEEALAARDRARAGPTAPPTGLCLMEVSYGLAAGDTEETADDE